MAETDDKRTENAASEAVKVNIFEQTYSLRSPKGAEHVRQTAQLVDQRMRQIAAHTTTFELSRVAILAALNIADELRALEAQNEELRLALEQSPEDSNASEETAADNEADGQEATKPLTWFEAIFDAELPGKGRGERLSSQISARLQTNRQEDPKPLDTSADKES